MNPVSARHEPIALLVVNYDPEHLRQKLLDAEFALWLPIIKDADIKAD